MPHEPLTPEELAVVAALRAARRPLSAARLAGTLGRPDDHALRSLLDGLVNRGVLHRAKGQYTIAAT
jgi:hypothetical protein